MVTHKNNNVFFFLLNLLFQELQDLGRDPPAQCSAGPVGDDCKFNVSIVWPHKSTNIEFNLIIWKRSVCLSKSTNEMEQNYRDNLTILIDCKNDCQVTVLHRVISIIVVYVTYFHFVWDTQTKLTVHRLQFPRNPDSIINTLRV